MLASVARQADLDAARVLSVHAALRVDHFHLALARQDERVHEPDRNVQHGRQGSLDRRHRHWPRVELGRLSFVSDLDLPNGSGGDLSEERAETLGEREVRGNRRKLPDGDRGDVHGIAQLAGQEVIADLRRDLDSDPRLRLPRRGPEVRRRNDALVQHERGRAGRLLGEHIERRARHVAPLERLEKRSLAARRVDDPDTALRARQGLAGDHVARLRRERQVERNEVRALEKHVERDHLRPRVRGPFRRHVRVVGEDLHPESGRPPGELASDPPEPADAEHLALELDAREPGALPGPFAQ